MKLFLFISMILALAPLAHAAPIFHATYPDNGVSIQKRVIDTYRAALNSREDNALKQTVARLQNDLAGFGKVRMPTKDDLFLLSAGESTPSEHDISRRVKNGKFLLAIPTTITGLGTADEHRDILIVYYSVQVRKKVEVILLNFADLTDRPDTDGRPTTE